MTDITSRERRAVVGSTLLGLAVTLAFGRLSIGLLLPGIRDSMGASYAEVGSLVSVNFVGYIVTVAAIPRLSTRISHRRLVGWGLAIATGAMTAAAAAPNLLVLGAAVALTGVAGAFGWVSGATAALEVSTPHNRGLILGLVGAANGCGIVVTSALAALAQGSGMDGAWRLVWLSQAAIGVIGCLLAWRTRPTPPAVVTSGGGPKGLGLLTVAYAIFGLATAWFTTFYIAGARELADVDASAAWASMGVGAIVGGITIGRAGDRWGHGRLLGATQVLACGGCLALAVGTTQTPHVLAAGLLYGSVMSGVGLLVPAVLANTLKPDDVGSAFAGLTLALAGSQIVGPPIGGAILDHATSGFAVLFATTGAAFALAGLAFVIHHRTSNSALRGRGQEPATTRTPTAGS